MGDCDNYAKWLRLALVKVQLCNNCNRPGWMNTEKAQKAFQTESEQTRDQNLKTAHSGAVSIFQHNDVILPLQTSPSL